jgi:hypothetical protein
MNAGEVDAILVYNVNPAYTWHDSPGFVSGMKKVRLSVSLSQTPDESSVLAGFVCPDNH